MLDVTLTAIAEHQTVRSVIALAEALRFYSGFAFGWTLRIRGRNEEQRDQQGREHYGHARTCGSLFSHRKIFVLLCLQENPPFADEDLDCKECAQAVSPLYSSSIRPPLTHCLWTRPRKGPISRSETGSYASTCQTIRQEDSATGVNL